MKNQLTVWLKQGYPVDTDLQVLAESPFCNRGKPGMLLYISELAIKDLYKFTTQHGHRTNIIPHNNFMRL